MSRNKLFSNEVLAGSRRYSFEVKESVDGVKYLVVRELRGGSKEGQVMVFEEYALSFLKELRRAVNFMKKRRKTYDVEQIRRDYHKAYTKWTQNEEDYLKNLYTQDKTVNELADIFQRKPSAIRSRLKKLGLY